MQGFINLAQWWYDLKTPLGYRPSSSLSYFVHFRTQLARATTILHRRSRVTNLSEVNDSELRYFASSVGEGDTELVGIKLTRNRECIRVNCSFIGYFSLLVFCFRFVR